MRHERPPHTSEARVHHQLEAAARLVSTNPFYVAFAFDQFQRAHNLDATALATWLQCSVTALPWLALRRRPDPATERYRTELAALVADADCDPMRLEALLGEVGSN